MILKFLSINLENYMLPCLNKKLFGMECPGCGIQRSVKLIAEGEFVGAFEMYPAIYTLIGLLGFVIADKFIKIKYANKIIIGLAITNVVIILTSYIIKIST